MDQRAATVARPAPPVTVVDHEVEVDGGRITVRGYTPERPGPLPCHVYVHGGGWWLGELRHRDTVCARLAAATALMLREQAGPRCAQVLEIPVLDLTASREAPTPAPSC
nr:alpha/beta hydrolase fold domain-containing protein [Nonomuraea sp. K271]